MAISIQNAQSSGICCGIDKKGGREINGGKDRTVDINSSLRCGAARDDAVERRVGGVGVDADTGGSVVGVDGEGTSGRCSKSKC